MRSEEAIRERVKYLERMVKTWETEESTRAVFTDRHMLLVGRIASGQERLDILRWVLEEGE